MPRNDRLQIIKQIEEQRKSRVIAFILGDRPNLSTVIAEDAVRVIFDHLSKIGYTEKIDLFLYTRGGVGTAPARIVRLIREYTKHFDVLVPYRCHSGGTVMCCGADNVVMVKMAEISPVDATTINPFNPQDRSGRNLPISVEDVRAYLSLANSAGLKSESMILEVFKLLSNQVNTLALGNVQRVYTTGVNEIPKLLKLHLDEIKDKDNIQKIIDALSQKYTHDYLFTRKEAKEIGLPIIEPDEQLEKSIWDLYEVYEKDLQLRTPFVPELPLDQNSAEFRYEIAYVESLGRTHAHTLEGTITRSPPQTQQPQLQFGLPGMPPPIIPQQPPIPGLPIVRFRKQAWVDSSEIVNA